LTSCCEYGDEHAGYVDGEKLRDQLSVGSVHSMSAHFPCT